MPSTITTDIETRQEYRPATVLTDSDLPVLFSTYFDVVGC